MEGAAKFPRKPGIYAIWLLDQYEDERRVYIGSALNLRSRRNSHTSALKSSRHGNRHLQNAWNKHGGKVFRFEILEQTDDLISREQFWIDEIKNELGRAFLFNICLIADRPVGVTRSADTRARMSAAQKGKSKPGKCGWHHSATTKAKMSERAKGRIPHAATAARRGVCNSPEARAKMSAARKGRPHSEAHKAALRTAAKTRAPISAETRALQSLSQKARWQREKTLGKPAPFAPTPLASLNLC